MDDDIDTKQKQKFATNDTDRQTGKKLNLLFKFIKKNCKQC